MRAPLVGAWVGFVALTLSCESTTEPEPRRYAFELAPVTFVVSGVVPEVSRVDIVVNGRFIDAVLGSFETKRTDRVTMQIPMGDSLNAFARGFEGDSVILYIGESYFDVRSTASMVVPIALKFKGSHAPVPRRAR